MTAPVETVMQTLPYNDAIPGAVLEQAKTGLVVAPDRVAELARYLRDQQGYDYCAMVTSVDWPQYFEVIYYLYGVAQPKDALVLRVRLTDKANPVMPSLTPVWPGADFQEREVYDMMGIRWTRICGASSCGGFEGHPPRKDYRTYYEGSKPLNRHLMAATGRRRCSRRDNVSFLAWDPDLWTSPRWNTAGSWCDGSNNGWGHPHQRILVNMGPNIPRDTWVGFAWSS